MSATPGSPGASQNLEGQTDALNAAGCEKIFADTASGKLAERPELTLCMGYLRAGDTLVVWRLDRLGRSLRHLVETVNALAERGVAFASLHEGIDTSTSTGRLVFHIFAALAEFARELIAERAAVGRAAAGPRPPRRPACQALPEQARLARARYEARDITVAELARALGVGRGTIYRHSSRRPDPPPFCCCPGRSPSRPESGPGRWLTGPKAERRSLPVPGGRSPKLDAIRPVL